MCRARETPIDQCIRAARPCPRKGIRWQANRRLSRRKTSRSCSGRRRWPLALCPKRRRAGCCSAAVRRVRGTRRLRLSAATSSAAGPRPPRPCRRRRHAASDRRHGRRRRHSVSAGPGRAGDRFGRSAGRSGHSRSSSRFEFKDLAGSPPRAKRRRWSCSRTSIWICGSSWAARRCTWRTC